MVARSVKAGWSSGVIKKGVNCMYFIYKFDATKFGYATGSLPPTRSECDVERPRKRADDYRVLTLLQIKLKIG